MVADVLQILLFLKQNVKSENRMFLSSEILVVLCSKILSLSCLFCHWQETADSVSLWLRFIARQTGHPEAMLWRRMTVLLYLATGRLESPQV